MAILLVLVNAPRRLSESVSFMHPKTIHPVVRVTVIEVGAGVPSPGPSASRATRGAVHKSRPDPALGASAQRSRNSAARLLLGERAFAGLAARPSRRLARVELLLPGRAWARASAGIEEPRAGAPHPAFLRQRRAVVG